MHKRSRSKKSDKRRLVVERLKSTPVLIGLFVVFVAMTIAFVLLAKAVGGALLDRIGTVPELITVLHGMSESQRQDHIKITALLDTAYPVIYGLLLIGMTMKLYSRRIVWWITPALLLVAADLSENIVQILILIGHEHLVGLKAQLTLIKRILILTGVGIVLAPFVKKSLNYLRP